MQGWIRLWLDEAKRLAAARHILQKRMAWTLDSWSVDAELLRRKIVLDDGLLRWFENGINRAANTTELLSLEGTWAKRLYSKLSDGFKLSDLGARKAKVVTSRR